jgi:ketosteroid isomerase-like protein
VTDGAATAGRDASARGDVTRSAVERFLAALNAGDPDRIAACVTDDFHNEHTSTLGHSLRGREAYRERLPLFLGQFSELRYDLEDLVVEGERAAAAYRMSCRWLDDGGTAHPVAIRGVFRFRVADGAIAHRIDYWDSGEFQRQVTTPADATPTTTPSATTTGEP